MMGTVTQPGRSAWDLIKLMETSQSPEGHLFPLALEDQTEVSCSSENNTLVFASMPNMTVIQGLRLHVARIVSEVSFF